MVPRCLGSAFFGIGLRLVWDDIVLMDTQPKVRLLKAIKPQRIDAKNDVAVEGLCCRETGIIEDIDSPVVA